MHPGCNRVCSGCSCYVYPGMPLDEAEWVEMWEHMVAQGLVRGGKISVHELRKHECWQAKAIGAPSPATTPRR